MSLESSPVLPSEKKQIPPNESPCHREKAQGLGKLWKPRAETVILLIGLACTTWGKLIIIQRQNPPSLFAELVQVVFPDILFFGAIFFVISFLYMLKPSVWIARFALVISALVLAWSVLDLAWLRACGFQLQPGILMVLIRDSAHLLPLVQTHLAMKPKLAILLGGATLVTFVPCLWCFLRPGKVVAVRNYHARRSVAIALIIMGLLLAGPIIRSNANSGFASEVLGFSSHWHALVSIMAGSYEDKRIPVQTRNILQVGQRQVVAPKCPSSDLPNVVLVALEGISHSVFRHPELETMPNLARLAREGVELRVTRAPMSWTTKAFWAMLTSTTPVIQANYAEAIPADEPYESLATLLARVGYRSGFFEMSNGACECAPGFFSNLGFDWAWFRENLEDPSTHLSCWSGDDLRTIKPAFEWALKDSQPFFLMLMTTVAHEPFTLPARVGKPKEKPYERYLEAVRYTDYFLGQVCKELEDHGLVENTILCVLGDHGTSLRLEEDKVRWIPYEEVIRVPWVIRWPGHTKAGEVIDQPCSQLDVTPTILKLIGFDVTEAGFEGKDAFTPIQSDRRLYFSSWYHNSPRGFVEGNRKVIYWPYLDKVFEYDLDADPQEKSPRAVSPDEVERIKREILSWEEKSQIVIDARRHTDCFLFSHWQMFGVGLTIKAYYVP